MKKLNNRSWFLIVWALVFVLWNVLVFVIAGTANNEEVNVFKRAQFWWGYAFIFIAFAMGAAQIFLTKRNKTDVIAIFAPQYMIMFGYFGITFILNTILMLCCKKIDNVIPCVIINVIIIIVYVIVMILMSRGTEHISKNEAMIKQVVVEKNLLETKVTELGYYATDSQVKAKLNELKELIHYSSPKGNQYTAEIDEEIKSLIGVAKNLMSSGAGTDVIIRAIEDICVKVRIRADILVGTN